MRMHATSTRPAERAVPKMQQANDWRRRHTLGFGRFGRSSFRHISFRCGLESEPLLGEDPAEADVKVPKEVVVSDIVSPPDGVARNDRRAPPRVERRPSEQRLLRHHRHRTRPRVSEVTDSPDTDG